MSNGSPSRLFPGGADWRLAVRICGLLIADDGTIPGARAREIARKVGFEGALPKRGNGVSRGSKAGVAVYRVLRALEELDLARRAGEAIEAVNLADIAAWVADELDQEEEFQHRDVDARIVGERHETT